MRSRISRVQISRVRISRVTPVGEFVLGVAGAVVIVPLMILQATRSSCGADADCLKEAYAIGGLAVGLFSGACLFLAWIVWPFARNHRPLPCEFAARMQPTVMLSAAVLLAYAFAVSLFDEWWSTAYAGVTLVVAVAQFVLHDVLEDASIHPDFRA